VSGDGRWRSLAIDISPLRRYRELRLLFIGQNISFLGSMVTSVAVPYQVYKITGSSLLVGVIGLVEIVAIVGIAFISGALADAVDRRLVVRVSEVLLMLTSAGLLANSVLPHPSLVAVFVLSFVLAGGDALQRPSLDSMVPRLVATEDLAATQAIDSLMGTSATLAGPAIGGVLIAVAGLGAAYGLDLVTFVVSLVALARMTAMPPPPDAERPSLARVVEGLRYARSRQELLGTYLVDMAAMFFGMPLALFPAFAARLGGPAVLGVLYATPALGSLLASLTSGWTKRVNHHGRAVMAAAMVWGAGIAGFAAAPTLWLALPSLAVAGGADMISGTFRALIWNITIPDSLRGRLASIELISYSSGPSLAGIESGVAVSLVGTRGSGVSGGALCIVSVAALTVALPGFWSYDVRRWRAEHPDEPVSEAPGHHASGGRISPDPITEVEPEHCCGEPLACRIRRSRHGGCDLVGPGDRFAAQ
jgi:MFS family permease